MNTRKPMWLLGLLICLGLLLGITESLARTKKTKAKRLTRAELLERIPDEPDILINLQSRDIPSTGDLVNLGNRATPALVNCLVNNLDPYARHICAHVLVATRDVRAIDPLIAALDDPNASVRSRALSALSQIESRKATPRLLKLIEQPYISGYTRREAILALGRSGDPDAIAPLLKYFKTHWDQTAQEALWDMRRQLSQAQITEIVVQPLLAHPDKVGRSVIAYSVELAGDLKIPDAVDPLMAWYEIVNVNTKNRIIYSLGRIGDARAIPFIESKLDPNGEARLLNNVIFALDRLGHDVDPLLRDALTNTRAYIRFNAAFVTGDIKRASLAGEIVKSLEDINDIVRSQAALALGNIADKTTVPALLKATELENPLVRRDAILALLKIDFASHRDLALEELKASDNNNIREELFLAIARPTETDIISELVLLLDPNNWSDRRAGLRYLDRFEKLDNPDALAFLVRIAAESDHQAFILLARFADPRTTFLLEQWLVHPQGEVEQIMRALARLKSSTNAEHARKFFEKEGTIKQLYAAFYFASLGGSDGMSVLLSALEVAPVEYKRTVAIIMTELDFTALPGAQETLIELLQHPDTYVRLYASRPLAHRGIQEGIDQLHKELDKKIPFIREEVLDIIDRLPPVHRTPTLEAFKDPADPMLDRELQRLLDKG